MVEEQQFFLKSYSVV